MRQAQARRLPRVGHDRPFHPLPERLAGPHFPLRAYRIDLTFLRLRLRHRSLIAQKPLPSLVNMRFARSVQRQRFGTSGGKWSGVSFGPGVMRPMPPEGARGSCSRAANASWHGKTDATDATLMSGARRRKIQRLNVQPCFSNRERRATSNLVSRDQVPRFPSAGWVIRCGQYC